MSVSAGPTGTEDDARALIINDQDDIPFSVSEGSGKARKQFHLEEVIDVVVTRGTHKDYPVATILA